MPPYGQMKKKDIHLMAINLWHTKVLVNIRKHFKSTGYIPRICNSDGISMNIYEESSACYFQVQSKCEWTLVQTNTLELALYGLWYHTDIMY